MYCSPLAHTSACCILGFTVYAKQVDMVWMLGALPERFIHRGLVPRVRLLEGGA